MAVFRGSATTKRPVFLFLSLLQFQIGIFRLKPSFISLARLPSRGRNRQIIFTAVWTSVGWHKTLMGGPWWAGSAQQGREVRGSTTPYEGRPIPAERAPPSPPMLTSCLAPATRGGESSVFVQIYLHRTQLPSPPASWISQVVYDLLAYPPPSQVSIPRPVYLYTHTNAAVINATFLHHHWCRARHPVLPSWPFYRPTCYFL